MSQVQIGIYILAVVLNPTQTLHNPPISSLIVLQSGMAMRRIRGGVDIVLVGFRSGIVFHTITELDTSRFDLLVCLTHPALNVFSLYIIILNFVFEAYPNMFIFLKNFKRF